MKLRSITLENVRRFAGKVRIDGIGDGLNVLSEPNEHGKSTLFDALRAVFFKPHRAQDIEVKSLRPHAGGAPEVSVEIETPDGRFVIAKRWLSRPVATITENGRLIAQADAAEDWIARLAGAAESGPSGLIWVRQGKADFSDGKPKEQEARLEARRDLLSSVAGEVEAVTGGRRMDAALARCRDELEVYSTSTGKPKASGPWKAAQDLVAALEAEHDALAATASELHTALRRRKDLRRALDELEAPEAEARRRQRVETATAEHRAAERHAEAVEAAERRTKAARLAVATAQARLEAARAAMTERSEAGVLAQATAGELESARSAHSAARYMLDDAQKAMTAAQAARQNAASDVQTARLRQAALDGAARRADLVSRIAEAEATRKAAETEAAAARSGPDAATLRRLEGLAAELATARAVRNAAAPQLVARYQPGRAATIRANGTALPEGRAVPVPELLRLELDGIGTLEVRPGDRGRDDPVGTAEVALKAALDKLALSDLDGARVAAADRVEAEGRLAQAEARLKALAPEGIVRLREALARIPEAEALPGGPYLPEAETALAQAEEALNRAQTSRDGAVAREADLRSVAARREADAEAASERLRRAEIALERVGGDVALADLAETLERATAALAAEEAMLNESRDAAPDLGAASAALARARSVEEETRREIGRMRPEIATLTANIDRSSGEAVEERLAETAEKLTAAKTDLDRIEFEVAVLQRLKEALETARGAARERYFAPVAAELEPLLHLLWPEADLTWGADTLLPDALVRNGQPETIDILSGGTQEQIALLVRLAFARMLAKGGRHAPVILDDALVYTDDDRIERMFDALHRQAGDLQILVLTCRQRAFRDLGGRRLRLEAV